MKKWMRLIAGFLLVTLLLALVFFGRDFPIGIEDLSYTHHPYLCASSRAEGEIFVDSGGDCYTITDDQELLRQREKLVIAEKVVRADCNSQGIVWLNTSGELYLYSNAKSVLLADRVGEFAVSKDSICYLRKDGELYVRTPEKTGFIFDCPTDEYPSPNPNSIELLVNDRWIFISGIDMLEDCYYDRIEERFVVMEGPPYFEPANDTAFLWGDNLLCLMGCANGGMIYHLADGTGQPIDLGFDASECDVRSSAIILDDVLYLSVQYDPFSHLWDLPIQEATYAVDADTLAFRRIDNTFYKQLVVAQGKILCVDSIVKDSFRFIRELGEINPKDQ